MILRRVIAHFKKQEWTAIALDFVIVVVGVFVGLQVNNWNAKQADAQRGKVFVQRLIEDLSFDYQTRTSRLAYYDTVNDSAIRAIELLNAPIQDDRSLLVHTYRSTEIAYDAQTRATWDEIVSSGEIGLLPRAAVQDGLNLYYGVDLAEQARGELSNSRLRTHVRSVIPFHVQAAIRAGCSDIFGNDGRVLGFVEDCIIDVSDEDIAAAANILKSDDQLIPDLTLHIAALSGVRSNLKGDIFVIERSLELLKGEIAQDASHSDARISGDRRP
ncbi:hypothetical protein [Hyphococcus sp.]|uniref:hypothetical protein n=1 Tax=Hyphococcus sp. TaxID=2038636 RepID=UPI00208959FB|nr:MAG: hypothetical protein DHS20C04_10140 [Marinicaulis sp.]